MRTCDIHAANKTSMKSTENIRKASAFKIKRDILVQGGPYLFLPSLSMDIILGIVCSLKKIANESVKCYHRAVEELNLRQ